VVAVREAVVRVVTVEVVAVSVSVVVAVVVWGVVVMVRLVVLPVEEPVMLLPVVVTHTVDSRKVQYTGHSPVLMVSAKVSSQEWHTMPLYGPEYEETMTGALSTVQPFTWLPWNTTTS
jgi:hypothetical protein